MTNIHLSALRAEGPGEAEETDNVGRLRVVTNSPQREYAARAGEVQPLPNSVAALILCKVGRARVERHQIKVTLDGDEMFFTSRDSIIIAAKNGTGEPVLWALNRRATDVLHLLGDDGSYIESIPRKGEATWFSRDAASQDALATAKAHLSRDMERLRDLHAPDTEAATRDAVANAEQTHRLVQTFPATAAAAAEEGETRRQGDVEPRRFARAEQFAAAEARIDGQRERRTSFKRGPVASAADFADAAEDGETPIFGEREIAPVDEPQPQTVASAADFC